MTNRVLIFVVMIFSVATCAFATDALDEIRTQKRIIWAGDQEGGGPYIFPRDDRPAEVTGFEVELAGLLARFLNVRSEFAQAQWDKLPDM